MPNSEEEARFYLIRVAGSYEVWELRRRDLERELNLHHAQSIVSFRLRREAENALQALFPARRNRQTRDNTL